MRVWFLLLSCIISVHAHAAWRDWFYTPDQQGAHLLQQNEPSEAAQRFHNPRWRAVANYRAGKYAVAAEQFQQLHTPLGYYNQGNALAHLGDYQAAIDAYKKTLAMQSDHQDARYNKALLEKLLKNQQQQKKQQEQKQSSEQDKQKQQQKSSSDDAKQQQAKRRQSKQQQKQQAKMTQQQREQQQMQKHMLRQVPDDPGGLLRRKFWRDHLRYQQQGYGVK